jgi:hypothetical protein
MSHDLHTSEADFAEMRELNASEIDDVNGALIKEAINAVVAGISALLGTWTDDRTFKSGLGSTVTIG